VVCCFLSRVKFHRIYLRSRSEHLLFSFQVDAPQPRHIHTDARVDEKAPDALSSHIHYRRTLEQGRLIHCVIARKNEQAASLALSEAGDTVAVETGACIISYHVLGQGKGRLAFEQNNRSLSLREYGFCLTASQVE
jgi:hypothetical protein